MDFGIWFLIGAALVFFMQAGFAMVETGFTRAKNAGNIIMKNLMDFCLGAIVFSLIGFAIMCSEEYIFGLIGIPNLGMFTDFANFDFSGFVFNVVFCATTATIVSGAMAERTKFSSYLIYSVVLSGIIYPIQAGWIWNAEGWLAAGFWGVSFMDFAGSAAIHTVGGISALIGAWMLGARKGKYVTDPKTGKTVVKAIPGHSLTLGALGVFILWFGWYGFNGAAAGSLEELGAIFLTTTMAPAAAVAATMALTWIKNGKPDVSMSLNGALAGLVAITAGCAYVDAIGAIIIGLVAGILVVVAVEFVDIKLKIDDPVGAFAVHGVNGIWGTLACGLFATETGLFYGGGFAQLGIQVVGLLAVIAWTVVTISITFFIIKKTKGLRVSEHEEIEGLDSTEHGLPSSYADFMISPNLELTSTGAPSIDVAVPVQQQTIVNTGLPKMTKVVVVTKESMFDKLKASVEAIGVTGMTVSKVLGCGMQRGGTEMYRGVKMDATLLPKVKVEIVVSAIPIQTVVDAVKNALYTGNIGDGKIFIYDIENVIKVRTGEQGYEALQDNIEVAK